MNMPHLRRLLPIALALVVGCGRNPSNPDGKSGKQSAFSAIKPERRTLQRTITQPGQIEAFEETPLVSRIAGYLQKVHVDIGDHVKGPTYDESGKVVKPGQVLAELWVPEKV